jgi:hypothetical protein
MAWSPRFEEVPEFPIRLPTNGRELALWNAVSTRFHAVYNSNLVWLSRFMLPCYDCRPRAGVK